MADEAIDLKEALERVQDDHELLLELFDIFEEDFAEKRININQVVAAKNFEGLRDIAHSMKGASSNISAKKIYEFLRQLEHAAVEGNRQEIDSILKNVDVQYDELKKYMQKLRQELKK